MGIRQTEGQDFVRTKEKSEASAIGRFAFGGSSGVRTPDPLLKRQMLYLLS